MLLLTLRLYVHQKGNYKWSRQEDFLDTGNANAVFQELASANLLSEGIKEKIRSQACGEPGPSQVEIYEAPTLLQTAGNYLSLVEILLGWR